MIEGTGTLSKRKNELESLKRALNDDWPEIQNHLLEQAAAEKAQNADAGATKYEHSWDGQRRAPLSFDSWWLKDFIREDVLLELPGVVIMNTKPWHVRSVCISQRAAYGLRNYEDCDDCFDTPDIEAHIERFSEGQFAAQRISGPNAGNCVGMAVTMRASRPPSAPILPWLEAIGDMRLSAHEAGGRLVIRRRSGGTSDVPASRHWFSGLYEARFQLARRLNLRGWYAIGMLMGYKESRRRPWM